MAEDPRFDDLQAGAFADQAPQLTEGPGGRATGRAVVRLAPMPGTL